MQTPATQPAAPTAHPARVWLLALLLGLVTLALYWPATRHAFLNYDDQLYVTENPHVQAGLTAASVQWALRPEAKFGYWHPLTLLSHLLDCEWYGLDPWGHHLTNILLHALNTALVLLLLHRLTGAVWRSVAVAALFGWHPAHVESVAWVAERKDVLSACFGLLSLYFYARYAQKRTLDLRPSTFDYRLSLICFACALLSKPMAVTLPFVMLLLDDWPLNRGLGPGTRGLGWRKLVGEKIPFLALAAATAAITFALSRQAGALAAGEQLSWGARSANALVSYARYLEKLLWPTDLAVFYPHPGHWAAAAVLVAGMLWAGLSAVMVWQRRQHPYLLTGWLWFIGTLVPVIGLVQVGDFALADRYTYLPSLGLFILFIWGIEELTRPWPDRKAGLMVAGTVVAVLCLAATRQQLGYWRDSETLFRHALAATGDNCLARVQLGSSLYNQGQIDAAIDEFQQAIRLKPDYLQAHNDLGNALVKQERFEEAIRPFEVVVHLKPDFAEGHYNLGNALAKLGRPAEAIDEFRAAIRYAPDYPEPHNNLGNALCSQGRPGEAIPEFEAALRLRPAYAEAHYNLGTALATTRQFDGAIREFQAALRLKPDYAAASNNLAYVLQQQAAPAAR
jgi:protein O-mannosyl-transferase